jgi:hypothetical protein
MATGCLSGKRHASITPFFASTGCSENRCFPNAKRLLAKGLCLRRYRRRPLGGFSEQASMTVDMGKFSVLATFRQLIPCFRSVMASSRRKTRLGRPRRVPRAFAARDPGTHALPDNPPFHLCERREQVHQELGHGAFRARVD